MWSIENQDCLGRQVKGFTTKWRHEVANVFTNLDALLKALNGGARAEQLKRLGYVHSEPMGLLAIDQKGPGKGCKLKALRLYVFPDEQNHVLHVLRMGDKSTQPNDIATSVRWVQNLLAVRESATESGVPPLEAI